MAEDLIPKLGPWTLRLVSIGDEVNHAIAETKYPYKNGADLEDMGVEVTKHDAHDYTFSAKRHDDQYLCSEAYIETCRKLRGSVMMLGPLLARRGKAIVAKPGGDQIGRRRLDTHFHGIQKLGGHFVYDEIHSVAKPLHVIRHVIVEIS